MEIVTFVILHAFTRFTASTTPRQRNGDITSYKVKYRLYYEWKFKFAPVEHILIPDLDPVALYTIQAGYFSNHVKL